MRTLKGWFVVALVAVWLPASSHYFLEHFGFIHEVHTHDDPAEADHNADAEHHHENEADNHAAADGLCLAPSGKLQLEKPVNVAVLPWLAAALLTATEIPSSLQPHFGPSPPGVAPPELSHRWQFSFRAALPARAPSIVS